MTNFPVFGLKHKFPVDGKFKAFWSVLESCPMDPVRDHFAHWILLGSSIGSFHERFVRVYTDCPLLILRHISK